VEEVPALRRSEEPSVALPVRERRSDRLLPRRTEVADDASLVDDDAVVAAASAGIDGIERPEVDRAAGDQFKSLLDAVGLDDGRTNRLLDRPPRIREVAVGRCEPSDLAAVDRGLDRELGSEVCLAESPPALEDVESASLAENAELAVVECVFDRLD
jgi:hypothetical protein